MTETHSEVDEMARLRRQTLDLVVANVESVQGWYDRQLK